MKFTIEFNKFIKYIPNTTYESQLFRWMYYFSFPFVNLFLYLKIKPNTITTLSNLFALLSIFTLLLFCNPYYFSSLWLLSIICDFSDGMVARITKNFSPIGSFYDSFSDITKIFFIYSAIGIYYNTLYIWIAVAFNIGIFGLMSYANITLSNNELVLKHKEQQGQILVKTIEDSRINKKTLLKRIINNFPILKKSLLFIYSGIFVIYGNFFLLLIPLAFGEKVALWTFALIFIVVFRSLKGILLRIIIINNQLHN